MESCTRLGSQSNLLSKVVLIRVHETHSAVAETTEGELLVVNFRKDKWLNHPDECAKLIGSYTRNKLVTTLMGCSPPSDRVLTVTQPPPDYSHPPSQEPPPVVPNGGSNNTLVIKTLESIHEELKGIQKASEQTAGNTGRTADNTEGLSETVTEQRDTTSGIGNHLQEEIMDSQASENN